LWKSAQFGERPTLRYGKYALLAGAVVLLYFRVLSDLVHDWWFDESASHGLVILPLVAVLLWLRRKELAKTPAEVDRRGLWAVATGCTVLLVGALGADFFLMRISLMIVMAGGILALWGSRRLTMLAFPLLLLCTAIPLPALINTRIALPLQLLASQVAAGVVQLTGGVIYRDGNILQLPGLTVGIAEACSGLSSIIALTVVALLMGFTHCTRVFGRVIVFLVAVPLAIVINSVRITGTVFLAESNLELAQGFYHSFSGWLTFLASSAILFLFAKLTQSLTHRMQRSAA
jgi:exosortase